MTTSIFSEAQISALSLALEKGDCPVKYTYITEKWAKAWNEIEIARAQNGGNYAEYELLRDNIDIYLQDIGNPQEIAFFDFGCGTGKTVKGMIERLQKRGLSIHYHAFDISQEIINICQETIGNLGSNCSFDYTILDFETSQLTQTLFEVRKRYKNVPVIGLLLGSTIGNFDSVEHVITNIMQSFRIQDRMVVGVEKFDASNEKRMGIMIEGYQQEIALNMAFTTLEHFWLSKEDGNFDVIFNAKNNAIEILFIFNKDITLSIWGNIVSFERGDKVRLIKSEKTNEALFIKRLLDLDLRIGCLRTNLKDTFMEVLIGAKRY